MAEQLFQVGIKGLIQNEQGEVLLLRLPAWGANPPHWDLPGGRMDPGEDFETTLKRELQEELGVTYVGKPCQLLAVLSSITIPVDDAIIPLILIVFLTQLPARAEIHLDPDGHEEEFAWFPVDVAADKLVTKFNPELCDLVRSL